MIPFNHVITGVITPPCSPPHDLSAVDNRDGTFTLTLVGTPQAEYYVVASAEAAAPMSQWLPVAGSTNTVNLSGLWQDTMPNAGPQQYYRRAASAPLRPRSALQYAKQRRIMKVFMPFANPLAAALMLREHFQRLRKLTLKTLMAKLFLGFPG